MKKVISMNAGKRITYNSKKGRPSIGIEKVNIRKKE
jgi:hypothetical protein